MTKRQLVKWLEAKQSDAKAEVDTKFLFIGGEKK